jgi:hypothetical protein
MTSDVNLRAAVSAARERRMERRAQEVAGLEAAAQDRLALADQREERVVSEEAPKREVARPVITPHLYRPRPVEVERLTFDPRELADFGREDEIGVATNLGREMTQVTHANLQYRAEEARARSREEYLGKVLDLIDGRSSGLWNGDDERRVA